MLQAWDDLKDPLKYALCQHRTGGEGKKGGKEKEERKEKEEGREREEGDRDRMRTVD